MSTLLRDRPGHFHGGLRLEPHKTESLAEPILEASLPDRLVISLAQQRGAIAAPCVAPGDRVNRGQPIGIVADSGLPVHASAGGVVVSVDLHEVVSPAAGGLDARAPCVTIRTDATADDMFLPPIEDWASTSSEALARRIFDAGVVGLGGAAFPTYRKVDVAAGHGHERLLIVNGAECEPWIACDEALMRRDPERVVRGAAIAARAAGCAQTVIAVEDHAGVLVEGLRDAVAHTGLPAIEVVQVPAIYPEGGERQLIQVLTGLEVPTGGFPADLGIVVLNSGTIAAVDDAVVLGRPLISRIVTITGPGVSAPKNVEALIGTPIAWLIEQAGGYAPDVRELLAGGPMMGIPLPHDGLPITKATNCLLALTEPAGESSGPSLPCIRCMDCVPVCPAKLLPQQLHWHLQAGDLDAAVDHALFDCIECGCCAAVCPSQISLVESYRRGKADVRERDAERLRADRARMRFEARNSRLERLEAERQQKLEARRARLADQRRKKAEIAAAVERAKARRSAADEQADEDATP